MLAHIAHVQVFSRRAVGSIGGLASTKCGWHSAKLGANSANFGARTSQIYVVYLNIFVIS